MKRWFYSLTALLMAGLLSACGGGNESVDSKKTLTQNLKSLDSAQLMAQAVEAAGLSAMLDGNTPYTLLLPDDKALAAYADDLAALGKATDKTALQDFVKAHLLPGVVLAKNLPRQSQRNAPLAQLRSLLGDIWAVTLEGGVPKVHGIRVTSADQRVRNGVIHFIAAPLLKPTVFSVVDQLAQTSTLEAAIRAAGLTDTLRGSGPFTLFAPTNAAFDRLLAELKITAPQLLANKPLLTQVLTYHVLASRVLAANIVDGATPATVQGQAIEFDTFVGKGNRLTVNVRDARGRVATVTSTDLRAANGVVHLVDRVFLPSVQTVVEIAKGDPQFSILVEAIEAAGLGSTLSAAGPFTVFAPTNTAFAALLTELNISKTALLADKPLLTRVLTYHVLPGRALAASLSNGLASGTVQGQPLRFVRNAQGVSITDARSRSARVVLTNVQGSNGVVHAIDKVVLPTDQNLVQVAQSLPQFSILVEAVVAANLAGTLSAPGPFTVFAPTNDAFAALLTELNLTKPQLLANTALLTQVLTYHVLPAQVLSSQIPFGQPVTTVQGQTLTIGNNLRITDRRARTAGIAATDVPASNGVIHVIDRVILPQQ